MDETPAERMVSYHTMAQSLVDYGRENQRPEAIAVGVRILRATPVQAIDEFADTQKEQWENWLDEAKKMRDCDEAIEELIERARKTRTSTKQAREVGSEIPKTGGLMLAKGESKTFTKTFATQKKARVTASSTSPCQLRIEVKGAPPPATNFKSVFKEWNSGTKGGPWTITVKNTASKEPVPVTIITSVS